MINAADYSQVFEVLRVMEREETKKIPLDVLDIIDKKRDKNYNKKIDVNIPLKEQGLTKNSLAVLAWINLEYLSDEDERKFLTEFYEGNNIKDKCKEVEKKQERIEMFEAKDNELTVKEQEISFWEKLSIRISKLFDKFRQK